MLAGSICLTAALLGVGVYLGETVVFAASFHWLLLVVMIAGSLRHTGSGDKPKRSLPAARLVGGLLVLGSVVGGNELLSRGILLPAEPPVFLGELGLLLLGTAAASIGMGHLCQLREGSSVPDVGGLAKICRLGTWLGLLSGITCLVPVDIQLPLRQTTPLVLMAVPGLLATELLVRGLLSFVSRPAAGESYGADLVTARILGSAYNPIQSVLIAAETTLGMEIRGSWALGYVRQVSLPVLVTFGLSMWALSAVVIVDVSQQAVRERFGKADPTAVLQPGLVVGLPWPTPCGPSTMPKRSSTSCLATVVTC